MYKPLKGQDSQEVSSAGHSGRHAKPSPGGLALAPPVDIFEDENGFTLIADIFGDAKEELVVRVTGDNLLIESATTIPATGSMELACGEIQSPQYRRGFTLSRELHSGRIETKLAGGMLNLRIPKSEEARPRRAASMSASADACSCSPGWDASARGDCVAAARSGLPIDWLLLSNGQFPGTAR